MVMVPEAVVRRRLTLADYKALPNDADYEIIKGVLYVAPRPRPRHQIIAGELFAFLRQHTREQGLGTVVPDADLIIDEQNTYVSPDLMYFTAEQFAQIDPTQMIRVRPDLVVEITSPISGDYDRRTKRQLYGNLGVPHYWIVDPERAALTEFVLRPDGSYEERTAAATESFEPALFPGLIINLAAIFA